MKTSSSLTLTLVLSMLASQAVVGAENKKAAPAKDAAPAAPAAAAAPEIKDPVAVVEGVEIKKAELDEVLTNVLAQSGRKPDEMPGDQKLGAYNMILNDLIIEKLINKRSADIKVTDEEVDATFKKATANFGSEEEVQKQIAASGQTLEKIKANIKSSLRQQHWVESQVKGKNEVTDADAEAFYKENPEQFKAPERVRASHILVAVKEDATPEVVTEKQKAAEGIAARAKKGEDFAKLAKELSEDPSAKQNSGDLDFFTKEQMVPEFSNAAFSMKKDEISEPVRSQFGYHVIKVTDRKAPETISLESAKPRLLAFLKQQKERTEIQKVVKELRDKADVKINLPAPAPTGPASVPQLTPTEK